MSGMFIALKWRRERSGWSRSCRSKRGGPLTSVELAGDMAEV
jgi:hypothetical protein